jgi:hypothetical protein
MALEETMKLIRRSQPSIITGPCRYPERDFEAPEKSIGYPAGVGSFE